MIEGLGRRSLTNCHRTYPSKIPENIFADEPFQGLYQKWISVCAWVISPVLVGICGEHRIASYPIQPSHHIILLC
jgi:hypothetical protein